MYHHILYSLPQLVLDRITDIINAVEPLSDAYQALKSRLLKEYEVSAFKRILQLNTISVLAGKSRSDLLTSLLKLCPTGEQGAGDAAVQAHVLLTPAPVGPTRPATSRDPAAAGDGSAGRWPRCRWTAGWPPHRSGRGAGGCGP